MWYPAIRPALFALDPERAHRLALDALHLIGRRTLRLRSDAPIECLGLRFPNRVGLAAGFDKNAVAVDGLGSLGFGFIEVGTVTPRPQPGQPRPRLFRLPAEGALINRLGFPNDGVEKIASRLRHRRYRGIVGVSIGKNANTPVARAIDDYVSCLRTVRSVADYIAVNVSSPNTIGLRDLQARERLEPLLTAAQADVGLAMHSGTMAAKEAANLVDLDSDPTKLTDLLAIGKQMLITRGSLTTFSIANDVAKYFAIIPAMFIAALPGLAALNVMGLATPRSAILSALIFNALIIPLLIPLALRGVRFRVGSATSLFPCNLWIYGVGGLIAPFIGIKLTDLLIAPPLLRGT
jgi:hypothetical protein